MNKAQIEGDERKNVEGVEAEGEGDEYYMVGEEQTLGPMEHLELPPSSVYGYSYSHHYSGNDIRVLDLSRYLPDKSRPRNRHGHGSRHLDWVKAQMMMWGATPTPITALLHVEFVADDPNTDMPPRWLNYAREEVVRCLSEPMTVFVRATGQQVTIKMLFWRQNARSHYFMTAAGYNDTIKTAFVHGALGKAEMRLREAKLALRVVYLMTRPMDASAMSFTTSAPSEATVSSPVLSSREMQAKMAELQTCKPTAPTPSKETPAKESQ